MGQLMQEGVQMADRNYNTLKRGCKFANGITGSDDDVMLY